MIAANIPVSLAAVPHPWSTMQNHDAHGIVAALKSTLDLLSALILKSSVLILYMAAVAVVVVVAVGCDG